MLRLAADPKRWISVTAPLPASSALRQSKPRRSVCLQTKLQTKSHDTRRTRTSDAGAGDVICDASRHPLTFDKKACAFGSDRLLK